MDWDDDEEWDADLVDQIDAVVANVQQQRATQAAAQPSQPSSPVAAAAAGAPPHLPPQQYPAQAAPLQHSNGVYAAANGMHKPPLPPMAGRQGTAPSAAPYGGPQQHGLPPPQAYAPPTSQHLQHGAPLGHVSAVAAELQARMPQAAGQPPYGAPPGNPAAQLAAVLQEKGRLEGLNKHLQSTLAQKEKELSNVKQRAAQLEKAAGPAAGGPGGAAAHRSAFQVGEMQRQLDSARQQLTFREQEVEDLKRQYADRSERLRQAEAALADLKQQLKQQQQQQQQQQAPAQAAIEPPAAGLQDAAHDGRPSTGQPSTGTAAAQRGSGAKRRQSSGGPASAGTGSAPPAATPAAPVLGAAAAADAAAAAAAAAATPAPPLLDPAVFAAAASLRRVGWMDQLMAACSGSIAVLTGAATPATGSAMAPSGSAAPPTVLLLRARPDAAATAADPGSQGFMAGFVQRLQQVACGMLPPAALLDCIASMVASSLVLLHTPAGHASAAGLPPQRLQLIAAGLHVAQHLLALDGSCRQAALGPLASSSASGGAALPGRAMLSSRVTLSGGPAAAAAGTPTAAAAAAAAAATAAAAAQPSWLAAGSSAAALPATVQVMQQHPAAFGAPGGSHVSGLLPLLLTAALWLGPEHEAVAAGALGCLLELARALQGPEAPAGLAPLFTSGAMELFMSPPALRLQALRLLQLLLEDACLARLFEGSLSQAAAARGDPGPPTATAGTSGGEGSATPGGEVGAAPGGGNDGAGDGAQPMQAEGGGGAPGSDCGPWIGAAAIAERLLDSFVLDGSLAPSSASSGAAPAAPAGSGGSISSHGTASACGTAVARAAMQLAAALREQRQQNILVYLLLDDACGAPGQMLAQRLVQLAEAALAQPADEDAALMPCPLPWPDGSSLAASSAVGGGGSSGMLLHQQVAWQQRLRVAQEALTLLRGLLVDESCGIAAMDDLVTIPATARLTLTTLSRLGRLEPATTAGTAAAGPQALPLAPWARAIGSSTDQASIAEAASGAAGLSAGLPACAVEDVVYLSKSLRRRVLLRLSNAMAQG